MVNIIRFFSEVGKLKFIKRVGWMFGGVKTEETESIADHSFRLALMSWFFADQEGLDVSKVIKMSLIHDLCIVYTGDTTPYDNLVTGDLEKDKQALSHWPRMSQEQKEKATLERREKEEKALDKLITDLPEKFSSEIKELWLDYELGRTKEGRFARQIDRVEKLLQATEYKEKNQYKADLNPFWVQLKELIDDKGLIEFVKSLDDYFYHDKGKESPNKKESVITP